MSSVKWDGWVAMGPRMSPPPPPPPGRGGLGVLEEAVVVQVVLAEEAADQGGLHPADHPGHRRQELGLRHHPRPAGARPPTGSTNAPTHAHQRSRRGTRGGGLWLMLQGTQFGGRLDVGPLGSIDKWVMSRGWVRWQTASRNKRVREGRGLALMRRKASRMEENCCMHHFRNARCTTAGSSLGGGRRIQTHTHTCACAHTPKKGEGKRTKSPRATLPFLRA